MRLWFTDVDYKRASYIDKSFDKCMMVLWLVFIVNAAMYQLVHISQHAIEIMVLKISHLTMFCVGFNAMYLSSKYRQEYSDIILFVNSLSLSMVKRNPSLRPLRNKAYLITLLVATMITLGVLVGPMSYAIDTFTTGRLFFGILWPFELRPYSASVYVHCAVQIFLFYWMFIKALLFFAIVLEPIIILAMAYKRVALDLRCLRVGKDFREDLEYGRLKSLMAECIEMER